MHIDPQTLRSIGLVVLIVLIFSTRATKGSVKQTKEGLSFGIKPLFAASRFLLLAVYIGFIAVLVVTRQAQMPWWVLVFIVAIVAVVVIRMPGTIVLTPTEIRQRFWFFKEKRIRYEDVMALQSMQAGRATRVMGSNGVNILHSGNHSASVEFRNEMEERTGKKVVV